MQVTLKGLAKKFQAGITFQLSKRNSPLLMAYYRHIYQPKQGTLAAFLDAFSKGHPTLTAVQIGANDGFQNDPLHKFIKRDHWRAFLLEPQPYLHTKFLVPLYAHQPTVQPINAALASEDGEMTLYKIACEERWATGLSSFDRTYLQQQIDNGHVAEKAQKYGSTLPADRNAWIIETSVATISPDTLLTSYQIGAVDLLQIDTEGLDDEIIYTWNLSKRGPGVIIYEHIHLSPARSSALLAYLDQHGYSMRAYGANTLAIHCSNARWHAFVSRP